MLKKLRFWLYRLWIIDCVGCGSLVVHARGLCLQCEYEILDQYSNSVEQIETLEKSDLRFRYMFCWIPGASDILSKYVYLLKSKLAEPLWHELASYFATQLKVENENLKPVKLIFVPIPSRKNRQHSLYFAKGLAEKFGGTVLPILVISSGDQAEQKAKSKDQRHKIRFSLNEEFTEQLHPDHTLIIVDDVITTGASFEAAYNVLKTAKLCPKNIELWAAFRRESMSVVLE